jgi:hypothetical protein
MTPKEHSNKLGFDQILNQFEKEKTNLKLITKNRKKCYMCIVGDTGTGKTTVSRLFSQILLEEGLIKNEKITIIQPIELRGNYIGETFPKTMEICNKSKGGTLIIDEAYHLFSDDQFMEEVVNALVTFMDQEDFTSIILNGYKNEIDNMLENGNQGFSRRFNKNLYFEL